MTFHPTHPKKTPCPLCALSVWQVGTVVAILAATCALVGWSQTRLDKLEPKVEEHAQSLARIEYAIRIMEKIDRKIPDRDEQTKK